MTTTDSGGGGGVPDTPENITVTDDATMKRAVGAAAVGNITEWFDFGVYAYLATTIEENFFPPDNPTLAQVGVFAGFAVSFLVRPLGGLFFGPLGDRIGRTKVLSITVIMMAIGTFLLGFIPPYASIGIWAPILLVLCRVVQGFSTGGEYAGAMTFIAEYSPDKRRGFFGSFLECGTFIGYALGATVATVIPLVSSPEFASTWAWRIPFFIALPLGVVGVYLRVKLEETPSFQTLLSESEEREGQQAGAGLKELFGDLLARDARRRRTRRGVEHPELHAHQLHADLPRGQRRGGRGHRDRQHDVAVAPDRGALGGRVHHPVPGPALRPRRPEADPVGGRRSARSCSPSR